MIWKGIVDREPIQFYPIRKPLMSEIIVRGRWAAESSARHYVQAGRQMLLALALPPSIAALAARVERAAGLLALLAPDLLTRLRAVPVA